MIAPLISIHGQKIIVAWIIPRFTPCVHGCQPPSLPAKAAQALGERLFVKHRISRYACPSLPLSGPHENTHTILTRSFPVRMGGRHRSRNYAHPYTPWRFIYICVYTHRYIENAPCCMQRRVRKHGSRDPLLPSTFLFERQSRHAMIFHFPRHPLWNTSTPVVERGIEIDPRKLEPPVGGQIDCLLLGFWERDIMFLRG